MTQVKNKKQIHVIIELPGGRREVIKISANAYVEELMEQIEV